MNLLQPHATTGVAGRGLLTSCAWCTRIKVMESWVESGVELELVGASGTSELELTHGICPACFREVSARAARERRQVKERIDDPAPKR
jgi:hypothetical protein